MSVFVIWCEFYFWFAYSINLSAPAIPLYLNPLVWLHSVHIEFDSQLILNDQESKIKEDKKQFFYVLHQNILKMY